jgi:hypothetical protein
VRLCQLFLASRISRHIFLATTTKTNTSGNTLFYTDIMSNKHFLGFFSATYISNHDNSRFLGMYLFICELKRALYGIECVYETSGSHLRFMLRRSSLVECVSVLPGNRCLQNVEFFFLQQYVQPCLLKNPKYTFYTIKSSLKLAYK